MNFFKTKHKRKIWIPILIIFLIVIIGSYAFNSYIAKYYSATNDAKKALLSDENVTVSTVDKSNTLVFTPNGEIKAGIIFYQGGKVEYTAYAPLMHSLAENGYLCILPHLTNNLAIFDIDKADQVKDLYPDIDSWYMAGHSLGGSMAAVYISKHVEEFDGLILLAAYSTKDLSQSDLNVISIYGSQDQVLNLTKYEKNIDNLPIDYYDYVIDGGIHSYFGMYGIQKGDGSPDITNKEQIETTADIISNCIQ